METSATFVSSSSTTTSAEVPTNHSPLTPVPVPHPAQHRRAPNKRLLFTLLLVLLVALSSGGFYFAQRTSIDQRPPTLSPSQAIAATATAVAQPYAAGKAGMFGFDAAHTHNNLYEHTISPANISRLKLLWSFATGDKISSSPAIANGMVYVGSEDKKLYAFGLAG